MTPEYFKYIRIVGELLPYIRESIKVAEEVFTAEKSGQEKKNMVLDLVKSIVITLRDSPDIKIKELDYLPIEPLLLLVSSIIDTLVGVFNTTLWKKIQD